MGSRQRQNAGRSSGCAWRTRGNLTTMKRGLLAIALVLLLGTAAAAQQGPVREIPFELELRSGFSPDPRAIVVEITPAEWIEAETIDGSYGFYTPGPVVLLDYQDAGIFNLYISVESPTDTVLAVFGPDGRTDAADDTQGFNPGVAVADPLSGLYMIHVGAYTRAPLTATIIISEIGIFPRRLRGTGDARGGLSQTTPTRSGAGGTGR